MKSKGLLQLCALTSCLPLAAAAYVVDVDRYFAYYKMPDRYTSGVSIFRPFIFLSDEPCEAEGAPAIARKALAYYPGSERTQPQCWAKYSEIITVCPIAGDIDTGKLGNACSDISASRFIDTMSLPQAVDFD